MAAILGQELDYLKEQLVASNGHSAGLEQRLRQMRQAYEEAQGSLERLVAQQKDLLAQLKEREQELDRVGEHLSDLQRINLVYQPAKDDPVDKKLADYINGNQTHKKASMLFVREQEGIYSYGKRRIFIKIEKDAVIVRVGGGF